MCQLYMRLLKGSSMKDYALYKGDTFIDLGTMYEISVRQKLTLNNLYTVQADTNEYIKKKKFNRLILIEIEEEER